MVFGSYARGAPDCGDLDLIVEIDGQRHPPVSTVYRVFFGSTPDVRIYLGTPTQNRSGIEANDAVLLWSGEGCDWRAALADIKEDPAAGRFSRPIDALPFRLEQLREDVETLEEIVDAERKGLIKWAMSDLPDMQSTGNDCGLDGQYWIEHAGTKSRRILQHIAVYMYPRTRWFGTHPHPHSDRSHITWGGARVLIGTPYVPIHLFDSLDVFELVIAPHITRRGPNGIWSIARGKNHPLVQKLEAVEMFCLGDDDGPHALVDIINRYGAHDAYLLELFRTESAAAQFGEEMYDDDDTPSIHKVSGDNLMALLATADLIEIDAREMFAMTHAGKFAREFDHVSSSAELLGALIR